MANESINDILIKYKNEIKCIGAQNGKISQIRHLIANTKPNPEKLFVLEGIWALEKALEAGIEIRSFIFCPECIYSNEAIEVVKKFIGKTSDVYSISKKVFEKISERDEPDGLLSIGKFQVRTVNDINLKPEAVLIVLDGVEIPGNIGTIIRSCDGAGADAILICNRKARLTHPKLIKGSIGAVFTVPIVEFDSVDNCRKWLADNDFSIYLADTRAEKYYFDYDYPGRTALIIGNERHGISREWYDSNASMISIPMLGKCDSLNVAIATTIIIYEMCLKQKKILKRNDCGAIII